MKKKIVILGSTGSIGKNTLKVLKTFNKIIEIKILSTNKNINEVIKQAKEFKVKNIIINDLEKFMTKYSKNLAVVNKESLICGWNLIKKKLKINNTNFIPIDSEHFSIFSLIKNKKKNIFVKIIFKPSEGLL